MDPKFSVLGALLSYLFALRQQAKDLQAKAESARRAFQALNYNQQTSLAKALAQGGEYFDFYSAMFPGLYGHDALQALWPQFSELAKAGQEGRSQLELAA